MEYDVLGTRGSIDFGATGTAEVLQNVRTLLCTVIGSVPLDRALGISARLVDRPINEAQARMKAEIIQAIRKYEPRADVRLVIFDGDASTGELLPRVRVRINV